MPTSCSITLIVPAFNEEKNLRPAIMILLDKLKERLIEDYEVLIFNDGSTDFTGDVAECLAKGNNKIKVFHHSRNLNLGYVLYRGIRTASKEYVGIFPAHNQTAPESLDHIFSALGRADVLAAYIANPEARPWKRRIISRINTILLNLLFNLKLKYYHFCFYRTSLAKQVPISTNSYAAMPEITVWLLKSGASCIQIPFMLKKGQPRKSKALRPKNLISIFKTLIGLFWKIVVLGERISIQ